MWASQCHKPTMTGDCLYHSSKFYKIVAIPHRLESVEPGEAPFQKELMKAWGNWSWLDNA